MLSQLLILPGSLHFLATFEIQDSIMGIIILGSTIAYLIWLVKRKL